jgi:hypothetical protein
MFLFLFRLSFLCDLLTFLSVIAYYEDRDTLCIDLFTNSQRVREKAYMVLL